MKIPALMPLLALLSCESVPPGPPLPAPVKLEQRFADAAIDRSIEITVDESGKLSSMTRRTLLRDMPRHGQLSSEQMRELASLLDRWVHAAALPPPAGMPAGTLRYGETKAAWAASAVLPAELSAVVKWLRTVSDDLPVDRDLHR